MEVRRPLTQNQTQHAGAGAPICLSCFLVALARRLLQNTFFLLFILLSFVFIFYFLLFWGGVFSFPASGLVSFVTHTFYHFHDCFKAALSGEPGSSDLALLGMYLIQEKWIYSFWRGRFTSQKLCQAKTWIIESTLSRWKQPLCRAETITAGQIEQQMCWDESDWIKSRLGERLIGLPGWRTSGAPPPPTPTGLVGIKRKRTFFKCQRVWVAKKMTARHHWTQLNSAAALFEMPRTRSYISQTRLFSPFSV